ncbi:hypothetical protein NKJ90_09510 [Mesorhizobium sp. M0051]|uniref:hypothetical protein n=1 Tax=Mesorhizobium sp. M0051 TaxID=2956862 RepID=UPI00333A5407
MAAAISVGCVLVTLSTHERSDLLVVVAIVCVCMGWKAGLGAVAAASLLSAAILLSPEYVTENGLARFAAFVSGRLHFGWW